MLLLSVLSAQIPIQSHLCCTPARNRLRRSTTVNACILLSHGPDLAPKNNKSQPAVSHARDGSKSHHFSSLSAPWTCLALDCPQPNDISTSTPSFICVLNINFQHSSLLLHYCRKLLLLPRHLGSGTSNEDARTLATFTTFFGFGTSNISVQADQPRSLFFRHRILLTLPLHQTTGFQPTLQQCRLLSSISIYHLLFALSTLSDHSSCIPLDVFLFSISWQT